ncbi:MAG: Uma2 family endonuclease [Isosphaeraceae bacterium]|nr:Uma2 family endonuclease [Isosphaeraceae bacterium]
MATVASNDQAIDPEESSPETPTGTIYDRSSLKGDYMVMIAGQTAEDFEKYAPETQFCEYFDGIVYMPSPVTDRHQEQVMFVSHLLDGFRCERGGGQILTGPAVRRLTPEWKPEPGIFVRPPANAPAPQPPALLVVEFHSPSTRQHDLGLKLEAYRAMGIPNIWMVDDREHLLRAETQRGPGGPYVPHRLTEGRLDVAAIPGFWIDVAWLWADPLPNARRCLERILATPGV